MTLDPEECWARLAEARHGVLATVHPSRGVDAVPVVFAVVDSRGRRLVIPVDTVKPKRTRHLQRLANIGGDPRVVLLVDRYQEDWSALWWVRVHALASSSEPTDEAMAQLAARYPQYRQPGAVVAIMTLEPTEVAGWRAGAPSSA
jgi:PPOX class probable F420-dependent enzyme